MWAIKPGALCQIIRKGRKAHIDVIGEEAGGDSLDWSDEREAHQLPQLCRRLRHQYVGRLVHVSHLEQPLPQVPLLQAHPRAAQHHLLHRLREIRRQAVGHEPPVADPHHARPCHPVRRHQPHHAPRLEALAPVGQRGRGLPEEDQIRHVDVEPRHQVTEELAVLPHRVRPESVDQKEVGLRRLVRFGDPAVHHGAAVVQIRLHGSETRVGEEAPVEEIGGAGEAQAPRHFSRRERRRFRFPLSFCLLLFPFPKCPCTAVRNRRRLLI
ncbi:pentafunctional AROM polypeptide [Striga asiatica]|uniref:Pentafunctional AROM polypeptide n=1 Tax=Striga asiatica TaxID=4170 RepID=A0A5A7PBK3_STRAF|nr:pentafunctional AROM polypeptide [Striga asiatica]